MLQRFIKLEFKSFFRSSSLAANVIVKIFQLLGMLYMLAMFVFIAFGAYYFPKKEMHIDPVLVISRFLIYWLVADLFLRYFFQQMPTQNIKPFLTMNIKKSTLVNYMIGKTFSSFFSWGGLFIYIPLLVILLYNGHSVLGSFAWIFAIIILSFCSNFLNILLNGKDAVVWIIGIILVAFAGLDYYKIISLSSFSELIFTKFYIHWWTIIVPIVLMLVGFFIVKKFIKDNFYLDKGLEMKQEVGKTESIQFLNKYGVLGTFINNDIRMIKRSKAAKSIAIGSFLFLFYGLLLFSSPTYKTAYMQLFMGLFVTGGFLFMFGQRVPSFDSSYYPLMMTLNVPYKEYLKAKWWLIVSAVGVSMVLAIAYAFVSWELYFTFLAGGLYNIGVNSQIVLLTGAYNKNPIDLNARGKSFGKKNNFSFKSILMILPQMVLPMAVFAGTKYLFGTTAAVASLGFLGLIGFLFREKFFDFIVKLYKKEKYSTIKAFKGN
ncbi:DUF5687 family protein [Epilithonimonas ginsengisoli]|uniref:DUF5687 family protein n=1 Tax=Epilithonimonas ginsengisoli TaxID=1245592 RepID=A0ABU4JED6_9FLAO|nr:MULTISPECIES: DUF5687 family protein [Chryseobacterium group]MBV6879270.1 hypothetical protein [Epilithonimonas sp. FP105]MDW8548033.1 DUF5687 family protein [Epilithonimonas ginsengisoli]OAH73049.1 hypothetical protein AXA65_08230 [Chryseobacterium sp. FP211-J200]